MHDRARPKANAGIAKLPHGNLICRSVRVSQACRYFMCLLQKFPNSVFHQDFFCYPQMLWISLWKTPT